MPNHFRSDLFQGVGGLGLVVRSRPPDLPQGALWPKSRVGSSRRYEGPPGAPGRMKNAPKPRSSIIDATWAAAVASPPPPIAAPRRTPPRRTRPRRGASPDVRAAAPGPPRGPGTDRASRAPGLEPERLRTEVRGSTFEARSFLGVPRGLSSPRLRAARWTGQDGARFERLLGRPTS